MTTNLKDENKVQINNSKDLINPEFADLFEFPSNKDEIKHEARMIMFRFLSEIERITNSERGLKKKLATGIDKSQSFITQLFNGDKIINLITLAKFQKTLDIKFKIIACTQDDFNHCYADPLMTQNIFLLQKSYQELGTSENPTSGHRQQEEFTQVIKKSAPLLS